MKTVISCSRRTDIPAFHYQWLQKSLLDKKVELINSYNNKPYTIDLSPEKVHSIILWSKNYKHLMNDIGELAKYNLYFNFTINGYGKDIEPAVPNIEEACEQAKALSERFSPDQIMWRFDPIMFTPTETKEKRLETYKILVDKLSEYGVRNCTISFVLLYEKTKNCFNKNNIDCIMPSDDEKVDFAKSLSEIARNNSISVYTCSEPLLETIEGLNKAHCVDGSRLEHLFGDKISHSKDSGQRLACGCTKSSDIGSYNQRCYHLCTYCYAQRF
jgi:hypothetical protein